MKRYSVFAIAREALRYHQGWEKAWRSPAPKAAYDAIIIGAGGHGLATAYYLGKNFGITNVAIIEKGWLGGGNTGRNTTIIRSNYLQDPSAAIYDKALSLYENLSQDLNYNVMFSPRGLLMLAQTHHEVRGYLRTVHANNLQGVKTEWIGPEKVKELVPIINIDGPRYPVLGALYQPRGGTARHDAVAWGYARGADQRGVDLIQNCEVTGIDLQNGKVTGVQTTRGAIRAKKVGIVVAGRSSQVAAMAGLRLPIESHILQAFVTEGLKPVIDQVVTFGMGHFYISQSDKGGLVFGGDLDFYASYAARGNLPMVEHVMEAGMTLMPMIGRAKLLRSWGGIMDMSPDGSPVIDRTPVDGLYIDCGWNYGGFKAVPASGWCMAHLMATDTPHEVARRFRLDRFATGHVLDEEGTGSQHNLH
ncbi:MAG: sarcosine oxidase subunit beta [Rhodobacteraceae bacterium GWF1_65_7]|nr:MAG: sarcosine oxidase subunit beta [Rhodobacteraceae bacterium GWF1_65_7]